MKKLYYIFILLFAFSTINAKTSTTITDGNWNSSSTWDNGIPGWGDNAIINHQISLNTNVNLGAGLVLINSGASLIQTGNRNIQVSNLSGKLENHGTIVAYNIYGNGTFENYGSITANNLSPQNQTFDNYGDITFNTLNSNCTFSNYGSLTFEKIDNYWNSGGLYNYSEITINVSLEFYSGTVLYNEGNITVGGTANSAVQGSDFINSGKIIFNGTYNLALATHVVNTGYLELYNVSGNTVFDNYDTVIVKNNLDNFYTSSELNNHSNAYFYCKNNFVMDAKKFVNNGNIRNDGNFYLGGQVSTSQNYGMVVVLGQFTNRTALLNEGAIYCVGSGDFVNDWSSSSLTAAGCGHVNVGCNDFVNHTAVIGHINIAGTLSGTGSYASTVTYNPQNPCSNNPVTYVSRDDGNWDDFDMCSTGICVWSALGLEPLPIYEYPKYSGKVIIKNNDITINSTTDQPLNIDSLALQPKGFLTIDQTKALNVNGDFIINSPSNCGSTGSLIDYGTINISGNKTVQRFIKGYNWHYIGIPTDGINRNYFTNNNFYFYNESNNDTWDADNIYGNSGWTNPGSGNVSNPMKGYIYYYYDFMLEFTGNLYTGAQSYTLNYTDNNPLEPQFDGWNLVSNPYPSSINWDDVTTDGIIDNCVYFYDDDGSSPYYNNYKYYIKGGKGSNPYPSISVNGGQKIIPVAQAFFVRTSTNGNVFSFDNSVRTHSTQQFYKSQEIFNNYLKLKIESNLSSDETAIRFISEATNEFDNKFDAIKMFAYNNDLANIYSITPDEQNLAINTMSDYNDKTVQLGFKTPYQGDFTIYVSEINFGDFDKVFLIDKYLNVSQNITEKQQYQFSSDAGNFSDRFELYFGTVTDLKESNSDIKIYSANGNIIIQQPDNYEQSIVKIFSADGKIINNSLTQSNISYYSINSSGVYIVTVETTNNFVTKKVSLIK